MKIFVTGATGFVGSHLCERLESDGHEVFALVRNPHKLQNLKFEGKIVQGDLNLDSTWTWIDYLPRDLDAVIHTAGIVHSFSEDHFFDVNSKATQKLIKELSKKFNRIKFTLISSLAASGPTEPGQLKKEEDLPLPTSLYGKSKLEAEAHLIDLAPLGWKNIIIRPPMVIGPRDPAMLDFFKMVQSRFVILPGLDGSKKQYSFICVFDLVEAIAQATLNSSIENEVFFVSYPQVITGSDLVQEIEKALRKKSLLLNLPFPLISSAAKFLKILNHSFGLDARLTPDKLNELKPQAWVCSGEKCQKILGIEYKWDFQKTIHTTARDYIERGWI
ncbi:MAG: NAD(P)-dependent oxidoreductase [Bdellovibrio sp.]